MPQASSFHGFPARAQEMQVLAIMPVCQSSFLQRTTADLHLWAVGIVAWGGGGGWEGLLETLLEMLRSKSGSCSFIPLTLQLSAVLSFFLIMKLRRWPFLPHVVCFDLRLCPELGLWWFVYRIKHVKIAAIE